MELNKTQLLALSYNAYLIRKNSLYLNFYPQGSAQDGDEYTKLVYFFYGKE
jgi:hypothetical protein